MAESLSSTSKSSSGVSYLQIYESWINHDQQVNGHSTIPVDDILIKLRFRQVLTQTNYEMVNHDVTREQKLLKLLIDILPSKEEQGFNQLVKILLENKCDGLANDLLKEKKKLSGSDCSNEPPADVIPRRKICLRNQISEEDGQMLQAQTHLSRLLKKNVDFMANYWSDVIRVAQTEAAFVQVQVLEHFKSENGNSVSSYPELFDKGENEIHPRIMIQADPGCGKTTYVNKLALDWANDDEYLRDKFDFVFLIPLQTLTMDVFDAIKCFLPKQSQSFFSSYAESVESKILLIMDGFDELVESSQWYSSVMNILNGQSMQFQFFYLIVTTRRSHVKKIPQQFRGRSLLIKGFDEESMKQFLDKQHVPLPSVGQQSNLSHLLQTPLFCAIYCSLHFGCGDPIELEDSYDLIKALVENSVTNTVQKKTVANEKEQLDEIGKFAFQMLDSASLTFLKKFESSESKSKSESEIEYKSESESEGIKPLFALSKVNLDLLIKRTIPTRGVGNFKEEFSLPHQLIAEYLAAIYFARSLIEEQLKQAKVSVFFSEISFSAALNLPFVRFFLFELLFLYLEKKYEESVFDNFINLPEVRFIWNIKSNKNIASLDNVSSLNFYNLNSELVHHSRFIPTLAKCLHLSSLTLNENVVSTPQLFTALSKCKHLQVLNLYKCYLTVESTTELARCIDNNGLANLTELQLGWNDNVGSTPQLFTALSKCKHLQVLNLGRWYLTVESTTELARCIDNNGLANLTQLYLEGNENVGSTPQLFTLLSKCKHLQVLHLQSCEMTVESTTELARCIDNNGSANLTKLYLEGNANVGSSTDLFHVLHKCRQLQKLDLSDCSMTQESLNIFLSTFNSNTFQQLDYIWLVGNKEMKVDDNFFIALEKCPKISRVWLPKHMESDLSEVGRKAKETLEQRGCRFKFKFDV